MARRTSFLATAYARSFVGLGSSRGPPAVGPSLGLTEHFDRIRVSGVPDRAGEDVPDTVALPSAFSYGVPGLLAGLGTAVIYRQGVRAAVASSQDFGRVLVLAVMPQFSAVCSLIVAFLLIGGGSGRIGDVLIGRDAQWLVSALAMVGGFGGPAGAWLAASAWDFATTKTWPGAFVRSAHRGLFAIACFALAIIFLSDWLILAFVVAWFGGTLVLGLILYMRARRNRLSSD